MQFKTSVSLPESTRTKIVERLNIHLANTLDLHSQVKQAHWTIKGPQFFARHELFDAVASHLDDQADTTAERISTLGGYPEGTVKMAAKTSTIDPFETGHVSGGHLMRDLVARMSKHASMVREMLTHVEAEDPVSADMLTEQLRAIELDMWFFESHFAE